MRALVLSGGAFRGAVQVPVIEHLFEEYEYDLVYGVSIGSINGVMFAQHKLPELRKMWEEVDGLSGFLQFKWWWPFNGLYSMKPLRKKMEKLIFLKDLKLPFSAGVVSLTDGEYYKLNSNSMSKNSELWDAIQASSSITGLMSTPKILINGNEHLGADGGFRNIIPIPDDDFDHIDIVACTPIDRVHTRIKIPDTVSKAARGIEIMEAEIFDHDLIETKARAKKNTNITVYAPPKDPGPSFEASKEMIRFRFDLGNKALENPVHL